ncbi:MAG: S8 family serine peptidase [Pirellulales bacterium]
MTRREPTRFGDSQDSSTRREKSRRVLSRQSSSQQEVSRREPRRTVRSRVFESLEPRLAMTSGLFDVAASLWGDSNWADSLGSSRLALAANSARAVSEAAILAATRGGSFSGAMPRSGTVTATATDAGSTMATAYDLGILTGTQTLDGVVGGRDRSDMLKFTLNSPAAVDIALSSMSSDLDLTLYNGQGQGLAISNLAGTAAESVTKTLAAGTYYVTVAPWRTATSSYVISLTASSGSSPPTTGGSNNSTPVTSPSANSPSNSSPIVTPLADVAYYGGSGEWNVNAINAPESWAAGYDGDGVVVAVIDTGVTWNHPDLSTQIWVNMDEVAGNGIDDDRNGYVDDIRGWDFVGRDADPSDGNGHGTHVAGIIAADADGQGATGVAPGAKIMPVRVLGNDGSGSDANVAAGIRYAANNGADIINLSLGGAYSNSILSAIQYAQQRNVLVVVAAGNESASTPSYPARYSATLANVISVGAHSSSNSLASFSNRVGTSNAVQVDAPGVNIVSSMPNGRTASMSGTSMAAPHVAGLAALALSANSNLSASQLRSIIVSGANRSISGSDSDGGINAALTVAIALNA